MRSPGIHGWIGGRYGSPTEYGLPLDDSYLYEMEDPEEEDPEPQPCACAGAGWAGCECQPVAELEDQAAGGDDWTPVRIGEPKHVHNEAPGIPAGIPGSN
jgi:hypothetical protein